jgi:membrane protease YdiL (CAAX protease family)
MSLAAPSGEYHRRFKQMLLVMTATALVALVTNQLGMALRPWVLLLLAPLTEEIVFRTGLQEALLQRCSPAISNLFTAAAFAATHMLVQHTWSSWIIVLPALLTGMVYMRTRHANILPWSCILLHAGMNGIWLA